MTGVRGVEMEYPAGTRVWARNDGGEVVEWLIVDDDGDTSNYGRNRLYELEPADETPLDSRWATMWCTRKDFVVILPDTSDPEAVESWLAQ